MTPPDNDPCDLCGFDASHYGRATDVTSTADLGAEIVAQAAVGLSQDALEAKPDGATHSIAELISSVESFVGAPIEVAHHGLHTMAQIGDQRAALSHGPVPGVGEVIGLHSSLGGVPKNAVDSAQVLRTGMAGDEQNDRIHHGRPLQTLCVWSNDVIEALQVEGHPIMPGVAGENITVSGIEWSSLRPGSRITVSGIPILLSSYAVPCSKVAPGFADRYFRRILHTKHDGWSRLYGIPLGEGSVSIGDTAEVLG